MAAAAIFSPPRGAKREAKDAEEIAEGFNQLQTKDLRESGTAGVRLEYKQQRPARMEAAGRLCPFLYADFFKSVGNAIIFPRCSTGTHFTFGLNRVGM
jgi:hypothetical protein